MRMRLFSKDRLLPQEVATCLEEERKVEGKEGGNGGRVKWGWRANDPLDARFKPFHGHFRGRHFVPCPTNSNYARFFRPPFPSKTLCIKMKRSSVEIPRESRRFVEEVLKNVARIFLNCCRFDFRGFCIEIGSRLGSDHFDYFLLFSLFFNLLGALGEQQLRKFKGKEILESKLPIWKFYHGVSRVEENNRFSLITMIAVFEALRK